MNGIFPKCRINEILKTLDISTPLDPIRNPMISRTESIRINNVTDLGSRMKICMEEERQ